MRERSSAVLHDTNGLGCCEPSAYVTMLPSHKIPTHDISGEGICLGLLVTGNPRICLYLSPALITIAGVSTLMPKTVEAKCTNQECELDMMELHYTYDMSDDTTVGDFVCPNCRSDALEEIVL